MGDLQISLPCECGGQVTARAPDAGGAIACACGRQVSVPRLSELRTRAGRDAYATNPVEAIRKAQHQGADPAGDVCVICRATAPVYYTCHAICESSHVYRRDTEASIDIPRMLGYLFLPRLLAYAFWRPREPGQCERRGHDVEVTFRLPVCEACAAASGKVTRPSVAKNLMHHVPLYKQLLATYPRMSLEVERKAA